MNKKKRNNTVCGLSALCADRGLSALVRRAIASSLARGTPTINQAATAAGMSVRTLQRRLDRLGVTYSELLEEVRFTTACRLLEQRELSLAEIALALGYSDPANFVRAVRRWTGEKPSVFRRLLLEGRKRRS